MHHPQQWFGSFPGQAHRNICTNHPLSVLQLVGAGCLRSTLGHPGSLHLWPNHSQRYLYGPGGLAATSRQHVAIAFGPDIWSLGHSESHITLYVGGTASGHPLPGALRYIQPPHLKPDTLATPWMVRDLLAQSNPTLPTLPCLGA